MTLGFDFDIITIMTEFLQSSKDLADAAALCEDDPIKQDMVAFIHNEFEDARARSEGVKLMVDKNFSESRDFILQEVKGITEQNYIMAKKIRNVLGELS
tara:strand:- start:122 stop:418 length:297 start_codon:yes stop_codon:yes gene_type:complete